MRYSLVSRRPRPQTVICLAIPPAQTRYHQVMHGIQHAYRQRLAFRASSPYPAAGPAHLRSYLPPHPLSPATAPRHLPLAAVLLGVRRGVGAGLAIEVLGAPAVGIMLSDRGR
jgi:hypothetical protein